MLHAAAVLVALLSQQPQNGAAGAPAWRDLDVVLQVVNEEMLTSRTLIREMARLNKRKPISSEDEAREAERMIRRESVKDALRVQAGEDLGIDPVQLDRQVKDMMRRMQERLNGSAGMSAYLEERDRTLYEEQELTRDVIHATLWDNHITGLGSIGEGARPSRDTYVRPGYLSWMYRHSLEHPELLEVIGGSGPTIVLQQIFIDPAGGEGLADDLRRRIVEGEDMGDLVETYDAAKANKERRGMTEPFPESRIQEADPALAPFVRGARPGDVSEVMTFKSKEQDYFRIVRVVERRPAVIPSLDSLEVQTKLHERISEDLREWRRSEGLRRLVKVSYIWPPDLIPR